jgi:hypothetical protein
MAISAAMKAWADEPPAFSHNCSSPWQLNVPLGTVEVVNAVGVAGVDVCCGPYGWLDRGVQRAAGA